MKQIVVVLFVLQVFGPRAARAEQLRLESSLEAMGSAYSLVLYGEDRARLEAASEEAFDETRRLDRMLSNYRPESEWSVVNRYAAERPVKVSAELFRLLSACVEYSRLSEGAFDISVGPLMKVWGFYKGSGHLPHRAEVRGVLARVGYRNILLDREACTVRFAKSGVELDPGGIGKGYAVDRMVEVLRRDGISSALVSASGSSIFALGAPPGEAGWKVRIRDPKNEAKTVTEVTLKNESMSTSGNYEKFFRAEGRIYSHIMDPRTGFPAVGMLSVSVIAPLTLDSEAWAKPFYINGRDWAAKHKPKGFRVFLCPDTSESGTGSSSCAWLQ
ncbi:MAG TPA: FAD:protein FMN transferase [Bryobacteraceae bacterium]|jgi:thiamine biosynthesis lipoprotein|nr:FAD:protein FMN transferase [Bryobacteraceae bacterium]